MNSASRSHSVLDRIVRGEVPYFALLHRPETGPPGTVEALVGDLGEHVRLADLPVAPASGRAANHRHDLLALVPYRQIAERGFTAVDDGTPLLALRVEEHQDIPLSEALDQLPDFDFTLSEGTFDISDSSYARLVQRVLTERIGEGDGANFVLHRSFVATIDAYTPATALAVFRRLLEGELSTYWTFVVRIGDRTLVGATPERHVSLDAGTVVMNPISGTYRYGAGGSTVPGALKFLADQKETDELAMVVDEELKMMAALCEDGGRVVGPRLKEMARLAHTEYLLEGRTGLDVREILRRTMFAPTVTGSPLESACRVLAEYEPGGRGYYSGVLALIGHDGSGERTLDSAIVIRTADIDMSGTIRIAVGATLVRHSDPESETAETAAKAAGVLAALRGRTGGGARKAPRVPLSRDPEVMGALRRRNARLSSFWFAQPDERGEPLRSLDARQTLVIDAEDTFTAMLAVQLRTLGLSVTVRRFDEPCPIEDFDLVVVGPGPGDPRAVLDPKIARLRELTAGLLSEGRPFLSVCLGHQVLCGLLGLDTIRKARPNQGLQAEIDVFGRSRRVGFYNTFAALAQPSPPAGLRVAADLVSHEIHALRGQGFCSLQFHPESVLTAEGVDILGTELGTLFAGELTTAEL